MIKGSKSNISYMILLFVDIKMSLIVLAGDRLVTVMVTWLKVSQD